MARRSGLIPRTRGARRHTDWGLGPGGTANTAVAASSSVILGAGVVLTVSGTLSRLRGAFSAYLLTASAAGAGYQGAFGIGIVSTPAFSVGITSMPTPITEMEWNGWLYHRFFGVHAMSATPADAAAAAIEFEVDSKAMRKMETAEVTMFAAIEVVEIGTATMDVFFDSRALVKFV